MKKIIVIGGGTGSFNILSGLRQYPLDITAVITMMDSGGSSGILRDELGVLPPGDVRRALVALSDSPTMRKLFEYRFEKGNGLAGHSFGNLIITALSDIYGGTATGIEKASEILAIKGTVLPVTLDDAHLFAILANGKVTNGEANIGKEKVNKILLAQNAKIYPKTLEAILSADLIILGPGDLYTSIIPNLLVKGTSEAICKSKAKTVFVCNIMTRGETAGFTAKDYIEEMQKYLGKKPDFVIMNNAKPPADILKRYELENAYFVEPNAQGMKLDLLKESDYARHDPRKLARAVIKLI